MATNELPVRVVLLGQALASPHQMSFIGSSPAVMLDRRRRITVAFFLSALTFSDVPALCIARAGCACPACSLPAFRIDLCRPTHAWPGLEYLHCSKTTPQLSCTCSTVIQPCLDMAPVVASRIQDHQDSMDLLECPPSLCIHRTLDLTAVLQMLYTTAERNESSSQAAILFAPESGVPNQLRYTWMVLHWKLS